MDVDAGQVWGHEVVVVEADLVWDHEAVVVEADLVSVFAQPQLLHSLWTFSESH